MSSAEKVQPLPDHAAGLLEAIRVGTPGARYHASQTLVRCGPKALPVLREACTDSDPTIRQTAVWAIGQIGVLDAETRVSVEKLLTDSDPDVQRKARYVLGLSL